MPHTPPDDAELTPTQAKFVQEYLIDRNCTQAALRAGYKPASAASQGSRLLKNRKVANAIDAAILARSERVEVKQDDVLRELLRLALVDIGDAYDEHGVLLPLKDMPRDVRRAIHSIEQTELGPRVKFSSKEKALELLGKHLGLFTEKVEVKGVLSLEAIIAEAAKR